MKKLLKIIFLGLILFISSEALSAGLRYHCASDSAKVMEILRHAGEVEGFENKIVVAAKSFQGVPYAGAADNDSIGTIVVRLDSLNQREFLYLTLALAKTAMMAVPSLRDFEKNLEDISRFKGKDEGFVSQYFSVSQWIVDNEYRGNVKEMTTFIGDGSSKTKTLDYVTRHADQFPAMSNPSVAQSIREKEFGYRSHRIPHLKKQTINNKNVKEFLQNGDIIIMNPPDDDFDIYDIGIVSVENGEPTLIHISKTSNTVEMDPFPLSRLFKNEGQYFYGYRVIRPNN